MSSGRGDIVEIWHDKRRGLGTPMDLERFSVSVEFLRIVGYTASLALIHERQV